MALDLGVGDGVGPVVAGGDGDGLAVDADDLDPPAADAHRVAAVDGVLGVAGRGPAADLVGADGLPVGVVVPVPVELGEQSGSVLTLGRWVGLDVPASEGVGVTRQSPFDVADRRARRSTRFATVTGLYREPVPAAAWV